jgi:ribonuclease BN (tRNA processing enzyme)
MIDVKFIGTGGAFNYRQGNSSALVGVGGKKLLVDCGHTVFPELMRRDLIPQLDGVLITHLHDDHVGSLSTLLFYRYYVHRPKATKVYVPNEAFADELRRFLTFAMQTPELYVDFAPTTEISGVEYLDTTHRHVPGMSSYAFFFHDADEWVAFSGDLADYDYFWGYMEREGIRPNRVFHELSFFPVETHTYYKSLIPFMEKAPIYGYHCDHTFNPPDNPLRIVAMEPGLMLS